MYGHLWRKRISGGVLLLVGLGGGFYFAVQAESGAALLITLLGMVAAGGLLILAERLRWFYHYFLPILGFLALVMSVGRYLNYGFTTLTVLFGLLGLVSFGKAIQAYHSSGLDSG